MRWSDQDAFGHVNNAAVVTLFEEARTAMVAVGRPELLAGVVVVRHEIDYRRPVDYRPEPVLIDVWVTEVRHASFELRYELFDADVVAARMVSRMAPYDLASGRPRRLTAVERETLAEWSGPAGWT